MSKRSKRTSHLQSEPAAESRYYLDEITRTLRKMLSERKRKGRWSDSEAEVASETIAYKTAEGLDTFFRAFYLIPQDFPATALDPDYVQLLRDDLISWLTLVEKDGFVPSPYSWRQRPWQSTEFAAFTLLVCRDGHSFFSSHRDSVAIDEGRVVSVADRALAFLQNSCRESSGMLSWSVSEVDSYASRPVTNSYSTGRVLAAVSALKAYSPVFEALTLENRQFASRVLSGASAFLLSCIDSTNQFTEHPKGGRRELGFSLAALEALVSVESLLSGPQQKKLDEAVSALLSFLRVRFEDATTAFSLDVYPSGEGEVFYYETRWSWADVEVSMASVSQVAARSSKLEGDAFAILASVHDGLWRVRDDQAALWPVYGYLVGDTHRAVVASLLYYLHGRPRSFVLTEGQIREAMRLALSSESTLQAVLRALDSSVRTSERLRIEGPLSESEG